MESHGTAVHRWIARAQAGGFARLALATLAQRGISTLTALVMFPYALSHLGKEGTGIWATLTGLALATSLADFGVTQALVGPVAAASAQRDDHKVRTLAASGLRAVAPISAGLLLVSVVCLKVDFRSFMRIEGTTTRGELSTAWAVLVASIGIGLPAGIPGRVLFAMGRGTECIVLAAVGGATQLISTLAVGQVSSSLTAFTASVTLVPPLTVGLLAWVRLRSLGIKYSLWLSNAERAADLRRAGKHFFFGSASETIGYQLDPILISAVLGAASVTVYSGALRLFSFVPNIVLTAVLPSWPKRHALVLAQGPSAIRATTKRYTRNGLIFVIPATVALFLTRGPIAKLWTGGSLSIGLTLGIMHLLFWPINYVRVNLALSMYALGLERTVMRYTLWMLPANLGLSIVLMGPFGVAGPLAASCLTQVLFALAPYWIAIRDHSR
jgi:O-antigen/teichoic acid export membrane protein